MTVIIVARILDSFLSTERTKCIHEQQAFISFWSRLLHCRKLCNRFAMRSGPERKNYANWKMLSRTELMGNRTSLKCLLIHCPTQSNSRKSKIMTNFECSGAVAFVPWVGWWAFRRQPRFQPRKTFNSTKLWWQTVFSLMLRDMHGECDYKTSTEFIMQIVQVQFMQSSLVASLSPFLMMVEMTVESERKSEFYELL